MGILAAGCSLTRFAITEKIPNTLWEQIPEKLKQYAFRDIDDIPEERAVGWVSFEDMLDTSWNAAPPEKGKYLAFGFRLDTRRIPAAVLKKNYTLALREEQKRLQEEGKKFIDRNRKQELREQAKLQLLGRIPPTPLVSDVIWAKDTNVVCLTSTTSKVLELFTEYFQLSFDLRIEPLTPYGLAASFLNDAEMQRLDLLDPTQFVLEKNEQ